MLTNAGPNRPRRPRWTAFTVLELLVAIGIIGLLLALLLPAVLFARESARTVTCSNQLRQVGLAMHQHHNWRGRLPAAWRVASRNPEFAYGWAAQLLPGLEQANLLSSVDLDAAPTSIEGFALELFLCPSDLTDSGFTLYTSTDEPFASGKAPEEEILMRLPTASYVGVYGVVEADDYYDNLHAGAEVLGDGGIIFGRRVRFTDFGRGLSHTLLVGERTMAQVPSTWLGVNLRGEDAECRLAGSAITRPNCEVCDECEFSSRHSGGVYFLWADGHVELVANDIEPSAYRQLAQREPL